MSAFAPSELPSYRGYRYPAEIIIHAVWLHFRFSPSLPDVEDMLAEWSVTARARRSGPGARSSA